MTAPDILAFIQPSDLVAIAVAWGTIKTTLNGTVKRVDRIETKVDKVVEDVAAVKARQETQR